MHAVSVNPVDAKIRSSLGAGPHAQSHIFGWDATGTVVAIGPKVTTFSPTHYKTKKF